MTTSMVAIKNPSLLTVTDLSWSVNRKPILKKLSFTLQQGVVGIIGPNGAGKTSLLRCILQHIKNYQGDIFFQDNNLKNVGRQFIAQHIAMVNQINDPVFKLCVIDIVRMGLLPYKPLFSVASSADKKTILDALAKTGLSELKHEEYSHLSGGEQQRTLIARAIVQKADLLILDEPTNHLDVYYQHQILQLVQSLGLTVLMTIHDLNLASDYCTQLILLDNGQIVANDSPNKVLDPTLLSTVFGISCQQLTDIKTGIKKVYFQQNLPKATK